MEGELLVLKGSARRKVLPFWWPPSLVIRQAMSAIYIGALSRWCKLPKWLIVHGIKCLPGAAGSLGMGCIGFPAHAVWEITTSCNLKCVHCHTPRVQSSTNDLTTEEGKFLLDQLANVKEFRMMAFTGGEPLMRPDFFELLDYSRMLGFSNTVATNATLVDDGVARRLRHCGVVIAAVSLDGSEAESHDRIRGVEGSFNAALRGIRALRRAGIQLHINITAMEYNLSQLKRLMTLVNRLGAGILLLYQLMPFGRGRGIGDKALDCKANENLIRLMAQTQSSTRAIIEPVAGPQYWPYLLKRAGIDDGLLLRLAEMVFHGCSAGRGFVYIKPDGEVWPCPFIGVSCGNSREEVFEEIWARSKVFNDLRNRETLLKGRCGGCQYNRLCGGCRGRAWATTGDYLAEDPSCFIHVKIKN